MPRIKVSTRLLADVEKRAARCQSFEIPSREEREDLWPGDLAKLVFMDVGERLWVRVTDVMGRGSYVGSMVSRPLHSDRRMGGRIFFGPENVADIARRRSSGSDRRFQGRKHDTQLQ